MLQAACANGPRALPEVISAATPQKDLTRCIDEARLQALLARPLEVRQRAVIASSGLKGTGQFLNAVPSPAMGLKMAPRTFTTATRYRLGLPVFSADGPCSACNGQSDKFGDHAVAACKTYGDRIRRHNLIRDAVFSAASSALLAPRKEERGLVEQGAGRPGDITIRGWGLSGGIAITAFDVTVTSPMGAQTAATAKNPEHALANIIHIKNTKYKNYLRLNQQVALVVLAATTFGAWDSESQRHLVEMAHKQAICKGLDKRKTAKHLMERLSVCLQRENAELIITRCPDVDLPAAVDGVL